MAGVMLRHLLRPGDLIGGRYRIDRHLAEGGMGVVLEATSVVREDRVAIKVLSSSAARVVGGAARLDREVRAASRLRSPYVARVFDSGQTSFGAPFLVMELLRGGDLAALLATEGRLPVADAVTFVLQACKGIEEAHAQGIVHRDLKPANLFLTMGADQIPCVKVLDFGVSKLRAETGATAMTSSDAVVGTPLYMAPEQFSEPQSVDERADIWALGVCLYELLTGEVPFREQNVHRQYALLVSKAAERPSRLRPDIPRELDAVILRCLRRDASERFASVSDLAHALEAALPRDTRLDFTGVAKRTNHARIERLSTLRPVMSPVAAQDSDPMDALGEAGPRSGTSSPVVLGGRLWEYAAWSAALVAAVSAALSGGFGRSAVVAGEAPPIVLARSPAPTGDVPASAAQAQEAFFGQPIRSAFAPADRTQGSALAAEASAFEPVSFEIDDPAVAEARPLRGGSTPRTPAKKALRKRRGTKSH
jgi:serine/threonine-protein kinase